MLAAARIALDKERETLAGCEFSAAASGMSSSIRGQDRQ